MARALHGIRVLELAEGLSGPMAAWFLAELGADVCKIEPPAGDRLRGRPNFHVLNRGKRSRILDPATPAHRDQLDTLLRGADAVIIDETSRRAWNLDITALGHVHPNLVIVHAPLYGSAGPFAALPEDDDLLGALSGLYTAQLSHRDGPVYLTVPTASSALAVLTAQALLAALFQRRAGIASPPVEVSGIRAAYAFQAGAYISPRDRDPGAASKDRRLSPRAVLATYGYFRAQDDQWLFIGALSPSQWIRLVACLGLEEFLTDPAFADGPMGVTDQADLDRLEARIAAIFRTQPRPHWLQVLADGDAAHGQIANRADYLQEAQVEHMRMVIDIDDPELGPTRQMGSVLRFDGLDDGVPSAAPALDAPAAGANAAAPTWPPRTETSTPPTSTAASDSTADDAALPLAGVVIIDLGTFIAGAYASTLLSDLGAEIIKVEPIDGDPWRQWGLGFFGWNRGKRSLTLNLRDPGAHAAFLRLVARADAVIDNYRPGVTDRLNITDPVLRAAHPGLINITVTSNGPDGPLAPRPAFDQVFQARSGQSLLQGGGPGGEPVIHQVALNDHMTASVAALGVIAGLLSRAPRPDNGSANGSASGSASDPSLPAHRGHTSLLQNAMTVTAGEFITYDGRPDTGYLPAEPYGPSALRRAYRCASDGWLFLAVPSHDGRAAEHWTSLCHALSLTGSGAAPPADALAEPSDGPLAALLETTIAPLDRDDTITALNQAGLPCVPCSSPAEIFAGATALATGAMAVVETDRFGPVAHCSRFARFGDADPPPLPGPELGQHSRAILAENGLTTAEIDALFASGASSEPPSGPR